MQPEIIDYDIITTDTRDNMINLVKEKIKDGWQPLGGISFSKFQRSNSIYVDWNYAQSIVKYKS